MKAYQVIYAYPNESEALQAYDAWAMQDGFIGGRVYHRYTRMGYPEWVFQGFFPCESGPECEGMRVVELSDSMRHTFIRKVFRYESSVMEPEAASEFLTEMSQSEGFIGALTKSTQYGVQVVLYFPANGQPFGTVKNGWEVTWLPSTYIKWRAAQVKRPYNQTWAEYARDMKSGALRDAVMGYLATWDYIAPDEICVRYLA